MQKNTNKMNKNSLNNSTMARILFNICPNAIQYLLRGQILRPRTIKYSLHLLFDLDTRASVFALITKLEAGPRFAEI